MKRISYGMVGGSVHSFIGEVHKKAIAFDPRIELVAGCFSSNWEKNSETADVYNVERVYENFNDMAEKEALREDKIDFVVITTPNNSHYEIAKTFLSIGVNVVCEKPLCFEVAQAQELEALAKEKDLLFCVTYLNTGYTMVRVMKEMITDGKIGNVISVNGEYAQGWLLDDVNKAQEESKDKSLSVWRKDPAFSGGSNCIGDIGTHIENFVYFTTGLKIKKLLATVNRFGQALDLNANILVEYENGANGAYWCSQVASGHMNDLVVRIYGDQGALEWALLNPEQLKYTPKGAPAQLLYKGEGYVTEKSAVYGRIPSGHTEGVYVAFANMYREFATALIAKKQGEKYDVSMLPSATDGVHGVKFINAALKSASENSAWQEL